MQAATDCQLELGDIVEITWSHNKRSIGSFAIVLDPYHHEHQGWDAAVLWLFRNNIQASFTHNNLIVHSKIIMS